MTERILIVARLATGHTDDVADLFAASDGTDLPHALGVTRRDLFTYQDLYVHSVEFSGPPSEAISAGRERKDFRKLSAELDAFVAPYDPATWRGPLDAMAHRFYGWSPAGGSELL